MAGRPLAQRRQCFRRDAIRMQDDQRNALVHGDPIAATRLCSVHGSHGIGWDASSCPRSPVPAPATRPAQTPAAHVPAPHPRPSSSPCVSPRPRRPESPSHRSLLQVQVLPFIINSIARSRPNRAPSGLYTLFGGTDQCVPCTPVCRRSDANSRSTRRFPRPRNPGRQAPLRHEAALSQNPLPNRRPQEEIGPPAHAVDRPA